MVDRQPELTTINTPETEQEEENADRDGFSGCSNNDLQIAPRYRSYRLWPKIGLSDLGREHLAYLLAKKRENGLGEVDEMFLNLLLGDQEDEEALASLKSRAAFVLSLVTWPWKCCVPHDTVEHSLTPSKNAVSSSLQHQQPQPPICVYSDMATPIGNSLASQVDSVGAVEWCNLYRHWVAPSYQPIAIQSSKPIAMNRHCRKCNLEVKSGTVLTTFCFDGAAHHLVDNAIATLESIDVSAAIRHSTGIELSADELNIFWCEHFGIYFAIECGTASSAVMGAAVSILHKIRLRVKSRTARIVSESSGIYIREVIAAADPQCGTVIQEAHFHSRACCAKVSRKEKILHEWSNYQAVCGGTKPPVTECPSKAAFSVISNAGTGHYPTVMPVLGVVIIPAGVQAPGSTSAGTNLAAANGVLRQVTREPTDSNGASIAAETGTNACYDRACLLSPRYPLSADALAPGLSDPTYFTLALSVLSAIKVFSQAGWCHGDLKPSNIMFAPDQHLFVVIDLGSAVPFGEWIGGTTALWGGEVSAEGSLEYELTCLGSILFTLLGHTLTEGNTTRAERMQELARDAPWAAQMVRDCYASPPESADALWARWNALATKQVSPELLPDLDRIWPWGRAIP